MLEGQLEAERARGCPVLHAAGNGVHRGLVLYVHAVGDERAAGGIVAFSLLLLTICWLFTTLQMLYLDMPLGGMLKNSLLIMFGYAKRTLPAGLITLVIVIGVVLFVPVPIMLLLLFLGMPALVAVIGDMWAWP